MARFSVVHFVLSALGWPGADGGFYSVDRHPRPAFTIHEVIHVTRRVRVQLHAHGIVPHNQCEYTIGNFVVIAL